jgi:hypothetical protein
MDDKGAVTLKPGETVKGYIPAVELSGPNFETRRERLIHWKDAARTGPDKRVNARVFAENTPVPQHVFEDLQAGLPAPVRRTPGQRYDVLVKRLLNMARDCTVNGTVMWPTSLQRILDLQGIKANAEMHEQVRTLARHFIVKSENQQRAKDRKKSVLDWHGHYA